MCKKQQLSYDLITSVVGFRYCIELFLPGSVPQHQTHVLVVHPKHAQMTLSGRHLITNTARL